MKSRKKRKMKETKASRLIDRICEDWDVYDDDDSLMFLGSSPEDFADCIVGVVEGFGGPPRICYDKHKVLRRFVKDDGMTRTEAQEYFDFNVIGAYMGATTPLFITRYRPERKNGTQAKNGANGVD